jgi:hypothetical protein
MNSTTGFSAMVSAMKVLIWSGMSVETSVTVSSAGWRQTIS